MKYSSLVPIRSKNEVYTPFSGIRSRKPLHTRAQSELPSEPHILTSAMGIQCDSSEFLSTLMENQPVIPTITLSIHRRAISTAKQRAGVQKYESKMWMEDSSEDGKPVTPSGDSTSTAMESVHLLNKIHFSKVGDWNETYVLKSKNSSATYQPTRGGINVGALVGKPCKIVEFSASVINQSRGKCTSSMPWQYKYSDKGVFNSSGILSLRRRNKINNKAKS